MKNLVQEGDRFVTGDTLAIGGARASASKQAAEAIGWQGKQEQVEETNSDQGAREGFGGDDQDHDDAVELRGAVQLNADGSAVLLTSSVEIGQGTQTSLAQIVAEELGISPERVSVTFPDTDVTPYDQSTNSSRTVFSMGTPRGRRRGRYASNC